MHNHLCEAITMFFKLELQRRDDDIQGMIAATIGNAIRGILNRANTVPHKEPRLNPLSICTEDVGSSERAGGGEAQRKAG